METFVTDKPEPSLFEEEETDDGRKKITTELAPQKYDWVAYIGGLLTFFAVVPQIYRVWKEKSAENLSYFFMFFTFIGVSMLLLYSLANDLKPHILQNFLLLALYMTLIFMKLHYSSK